MVVDIQGEVMVVHSSCLAGYIYGHASISLLVLFGALCWLPHISAH